MNLIKEVKNRVDILDVSRFYGLELNKANKCRCPFHKENTASFSVSQSKQIFHCFGCGVGGDAISLVSKLLKINAYEAAKSINYNLGLGLDFNSPVPKYEVNRYKEKRKLEEKFKKWELETFILLTDYSNLLYEWKKIKNVDNELYIEALQKILYIEYVIDLFLNGSTEDKIWFWKHEKKVVRRIESRVRTFRAIN